MEWLKDLFLGASVGHSIFILSLTIAAGLFLAKIRIAGISLGVTFILFAGILFAELGMVMNEDARHFFQEFGLILFVFSVGLQVGSSFFENFRSGGARLNLLAAFVVLLGGGITILIHYLTKIDIPTMVGIMSGAITNTPGLGAAQQTFTDLTGTNNPAIGQGYAVAYPLGVVGIILSMIIIRGLFRISIPKEEENALSKADDNSLFPQPLSLVINNPAIYGKSVHELAHLLPGLKFVVSRILKHDTGEISIAMPETRLQANDRLFIIAKAGDVQQIEAMIGYQVNMDRTQWVPTNANFSARRILLTKRNLTGQTIANLNLRALHGVTITRVERSGLEFVATPDLKLQYGDTLTVVGSESALHTVEEILGNAIKNLYVPNLIAIFIGICLGVLLGSMPFKIPGIPQPIKLGLAGGPLIVSILLATFGYRYKLITYTTTSANLMIRELGICIFLACVGLGAGNGFIDTIINHGGLIWVAYGFIITIVPLLVVGIISRLFFKTNYLTLIGAIAGSTTDPPALAYANSLSTSSAAQMGYATVYPLTMFMRVVMAQLLIIIFV